MLTLTAGNTSSAIRATAETDIAIARPTADGTKFYAEISYDNSAWSQWRLGWQSSNAQMVAGANQGVLPYFRFVCVSGAIECGVVPHADDVADYLRGDSAAGQLAAAAGLTPEQVVDWIEVGSAAWHVAASGDVTFVTDTANIQAAIDACYAAGGGTVYLDSAIYYAHGLVPKSGVVVKGVIPRFAFGAVCPDLNFEPESGTRIFGDAVQVTGIAPGNPTTITVSGGHGIINGASISVGGAFQDGTSATDIGPLINGIESTATVTSPTTLTIPIDTTGKTYTQGAWIASKNIIEYNTTDKTSPPATSDAVSNFWMRDICLGKCKSAIKAGAKNAQSFGFGGLQNFFVYLATHDAINVANFQHWNWHVVKMYKVQQAGSLGCYHASCQPGNSVCIDFYAYIFYASNPAYGMKMYATYAGAASGGNLFNYMTFVRPQINAFGGSKTLRSRNAHWKFVGDYANAAYVNQCTLIDPDVEGAMESNFDTFSSISLTLQNVTGPSTATEVAQSIRLERAQYTIVYAKSANVSVNMTDQSSDPSFMYGVAGWHVGSGSYKMRGAYYLAKKTDGSTADNNMHFGGGANEYNQLMYDSQTTQQLIPGGTQNLTPIQGKPTTIGATKANWGRFDFGNDTVVTVTAGSTTQSLPDPTAANMYGFRITFKNGAGITTTTINSQGSSKTIDGAASVSLAAEYNFKTFMSNGTEWQVVATG